MRRLIALEPEVYERLRAKEKPTEHKIPEQRVLSALDKEMNDILNSNRSDSEKIKLYNATLQKSRFYQRKVRPKEFVIKTKPTPEENILKKTKKKVKAKQLLKDIKEQKNLSWDSEGRMLLDERPLPGRNIDDLLLSTLKDKKPDLQKFQSVLWKSL